MVKMKMSIKKMNKENKENEFREFLYSRMYKKLNRNDIQKISSMFFDYSHFIENETEERYEKIIDNIMYEIRKKD